MLIYNTSLATSPFCATVQFSYDGLIYSIFDCVSTFGPFSLLQPLPYLPTYMEPVETVSPSLTSSSLSSYTPTPSPSAAASKKNLLVTIIPSVLGAIVGLSGLVAALCLRRKIRLRGPFSQNEPKDESAPLAAPFTQNEPKVESTLPAAVNRGPKSHGSFFPPQDGLSVQQWKSRYLSPTSKESKFLAFLSAYGQFGVSLRELIMLGTLWQSGLKSKNHWLKNGELGRFLDVLYHETPLRPWEPPIFWDVFMDAVCSSSHIEYLQIRLRDFDLIDVIYPEGTSMNTVSQYWYTDGRIWIRRRDQGLELEEPFNDSTSARDLLGVFMEMPDKDVSPLARRQREIYHYHAQFHVRQIIKYPGLLKDDGLLQQVIFVTMQLLTHRYKEDDARLLDFVRGYISIHPLPVREKQIELLWAELNEYAFKKNHEGLCRTRERLLRFWTSKGLSVTPRQNGLVGFFLVDLMKSAKAANFEDVVLHAVQVGKEWVARTLSKNGSLSPLEHTALCEAFAAFEIQDRPTDLPPSFHILYGYHLSRVGLLAQGSRFLDSGLKHFGLTPLWSYEFEKISIVLRLGQWDQAAQLLDSIRQLAVYNRDKGPHRFLWKRSGECAETFMLLHLYDADCYASADRLDDACEKLKSAITITSSMHDAYFHSLRTTLKMRLLEVRMWQQNLEEALTVALELARDVRNPTMKALFAFDTIYAIVQQLLNLSNILLSTGDSSNVLVVLEHVAKIDTKLPIELTSELQSYIQQRRSTVRQIFRTEPSRQESKIRTIATGIKEPITQAGTDLENELRISEKTDSPAFKMKSQRTSSEGTFPEPRHLQELGIKGRQRKIKDLSRYNPSLRQLIQAPPPPLTQPSISVARSGETSSLSEEDPSQIGLERITTVAQLN